MSLMEHGYKLQVLINTWLIIVTFVTFLGKNMTHF